MGKRQKNQKKGPQYPKKIKLHKEDASFNNMEDEVDAFHKKRDIIPLDIDADDIVSDEDDDDEQPIFDYEGIDGDDDEDDEFEEDGDDDSNLKGYAAKLARQEKYLREKIGGVEEEEDDYAGEDEKKPKVWSRGKSAYYGSENKDFELQSDDEDTPAEEEEEVIKLQKERAESLRAEDFGIESDEQEDSDQEPTLEEMKVKGKPKSKSIDKEAELDAVPMYEEVKKDLAALSKEEQMDVVYSSAPELVGLLAELNDATKQLETCVNPFLSKVRKGENAKKDRLHYLEVKQLLLLSYCQAIAFYLLLKSEGQPVRDHPVIARLVEIKSLLDKMKELDKHIPDGFEDVLVEKSDTVTAKKPTVKGSVISSDLYAKVNELNGSSTEKQEPGEVRDVAEPVQMQPVKLNEKNQRKYKHKDQQVSSESVKMLQYRAALEEKLKQKAGPAAAKTDNSMKQKLKKLTGKLETTDDFDDDIMGLEGATRGIKRASTLSSKLSQIVPTKGNMLKGVSGDDDLPKRDDLGERRWKHELRVLSGAGITSKDDDYDAQLENEPESMSDDGPNDENGGPEDYYNLIKRQREAKRRFKAEKYSRNPQGLYEPETTADGKRHITTQMAKNRGLTRPRNKQIKNPRKKYKLKHAKAINSRKGQVREVKQSRFSYGGETTGINPRISRCTRLGG